MRDYSFHDVRIPKNVRCTIDTTGDEVTYDFSAENIKDRVPALIERIAHEIAYEEKWQRDANAVLEEDQHEDASMAADILFKTEIHIAELKRIRELLHKGEGFTSTLSIIISKLFSTDPSR